jgi:hypothetical protein
VWELSILSAGPPVGPAVPVRRVCVHLQPGEEPVAPPGRSPGWPSLHLPRLQQNILQVASVLDPNPDPDPRVFGLPDPDPDPLVRGMDPALDPDPDKP